ncbi:hypothetical protein AAFF_G00411860 [Aldrovandia affinis]|uniref:ZP domain-containing protein n=1 Tax=Aldrovandia affinis TaxID=143900 RepID=A0AAD7SBD4_9TELE|nr:hypothetical protein AAFF_G00411860 [Aldrovandia affinis]
MDAIFFGVVLFASFTAARDVLRLTGNIQARCLSDTLLIQVSKDFTDANNVTFFVQDRNGAAFLLSPSLSAKCGYKQQLNHKGEVEVTVSFVACHMYLQDQRLRISLGMKHVPRGISGPVNTEYLSLFCPHKASNVLRRVVCEEAYVEVSQKLDAQLNDLNAGRTSQWRFEVRDRAGKTVARDKSWISAQGSVVLAHRWDGLVTIRVPHSSPLIMSKDYNGFRTLDYSMVAKNQEIPGSQYNLSAVCPVAQVSCRDGKVFASAANVKLLASPGGAEDLSLRMQLDGVTVSQDDSAAMGYTLSLGEQQLQLSFSTGTHPLPNTDSSKGKVNGHRMSLVHVWRGQGEKQDSRVLIHVPPHSCHSPQPSASFTVSVMKEGFNVTYGPVPMAYNLTSVSVDGEQFQSAKKTRGGLQVELLPGQHLYYVSILARFGSRLVLPKYIRGLVSQYSITPALRFLGPGQQERVVKGEVFTHSQEDIVLPTLEGYCRNSSVCFKLRRGNADHLWSLHVWDSAFQPQQAAKRLHSLDNYRDMAHLCVDVGSPDLLHQRVSEEGQMLVLGVAYRVLRSGEVKVGAQHACPFPPAKELTCTAEGKFVVSRLRLSASPRAPLDLVTLRDLSCRPTAASNGTVSFTFPLTACGTIRKVQDGFVDYENTISNVNLLNGSAPEYLKFDSTLVCRYSTAGVPLLKSRKELHPSLLPAHSQGKLLLHMHIMKDSAFSVAFRGEEYPVVKQLQEPVFVEVGVRSSDPQVEIFLKNCWGSPSPEPGHPFTWSIIKDGCEVKEDEYSTIFHKVLSRSRTLLPQHYKHFEVKTFAFVEPQLRELLNRPIHFHCSVVICDLTALSIDEDCRAQCIPDKQRTGRSAGSEGKREELVISGSVQLVSTVHSRSTALADAESATLVVLPCVMAAFSSLLFLCLLLQALQRLQSNSSNKSTCS